MTVIKNPFTSPDAFKVVKFSSDEEEPSATIIDEKPQDPIKEEKGGKEKEIEDVLDIENPQFSSDDEQEEAKKETKQALESDDDDIDYTALAKQNVKAGIWVDYKDSDTLVLDKNTFKELFELQENQKKTKIHEDLYKGIDNEEKEFLEFKKNGGDLDLYYQTRFRKKAIENLDISTDQGKVATVFTYYKNVVGWNDDKIQKHINKITADLELDEEAQEAYQKLDEKVKKEHQDLVDAQNLAVKEWQDKENQYKKSLREVLKDKNVTGTKVNSVIESFTKYDDRGLSPIDKTFLQFKSDPKLALELLDFLTSPEDYIKEKSKKLVDKSKEATFLELKSAKKETSETSRVETTSKHRGLPFS